MISYYTTLIDEFSPQLQRITVDKCKAVQTEIANLRRQLADQLKNFGPDRVDEHFNETMANAESDRELYELSNAYEDPLMAPLKGVKEKIKALRVS